MRRRTWGFGAALATVGALAAACGSSSPGPSRSTGPIPLAAFPDEYAQAFCHRIYTCCDAAERATNEWWGPTERACALTNAGLLFSLIVEVDAHITAGTVIYHADEARRCVDTVFAMTCVERGTEIELLSVPGCAQMVEATLALGQACFRGHECVSRRCEASICTAVPGEGEACTASTGCTEGLQCTVDDSSALFCRVPKEVGQPCADNQACLNYNCPQPVGSEPRVCAPLPFCDGV